MSNNSTLKKFFHEAMEENFKNNFCEEVTEERRLQEVEGRIWYLPIQGVLDETRASTKLRVVYDGSSKFQGTSLNDNIFPGPKLQPDLVELLLRFRLGKYTLTSDISKMFNQIRLADSEKDYFRFLYRTDPKEDICEYRFTRVVFGINSSPFQSIMTIKALCHEMNEEFPEATNVVRNFLYVDDFTYSSDSIEKLKRIIKDTIEMFKKGGFKLAKFHTNCPEIVKEMPLDSLHPSIRHYHDEEFPQESIFKTLGIEFHGGRDEFSFNIPKLIAEWHNPNGATKRTILSDTAKIYDPMGLLSPLITPLKIFIQDLWIKKAEWDAPLTKEFETTWMLIYEGFCKSAEKIVFKRYVFAENENTQFKAIKPSAKSSTKKVEQDLTITFHDSAPQIQTLKGDLTQQGGVNLHTQAEVDLGKQLNLRSEEKFNHAQSIELMEQDLRNKGINLSLHGFCDASSRAYAAVIYARFVRGGKVETTLLMAKSRLAPIKALTTPRLELNSAQLLSNMMTYVRKIIKIESSKCYLYGDSEIVQAWLTKHPQTLKMFCANRVADIQAKTENCHWYHVSGTKNPADLNSRGMTPDEFNHSKLWFRGPDFLLKDFSFHPKKKVYSTDLEAREKTVTLVATLLPEQDRFLLLRDKNGKLRYNDLMKLVRIYNKVREVCNIWTKGGDRFSQRNALT